MAQDIVPELWAQIQKRYTAYVKADTEIQRIYRLIKAGTATHAETQRFAFRSAEITSRALIESMPAGVLPNDKMYWNIAQRTMLPIMDISHAAVIDTAAQVQTVLNEAAGIGLKPVRPAQNREIVTGLMNKAANAADTASLHRVLGEPVQTTVRHYANDFIQANAEFHARAGLDPQLSRQSMGDAKVCEWCQDLAWSGNYSDHPKDIYRRHDCCRCMVLFTPRKGSKKFTDVHSKKEYGSVRVAKADNDSQTFVRKKTLKEREKKRLADAPKIKVGDREYPKVINTTRQNRHIASSGGYVPGRSILSVDPSELIEKYAGKGGPVIANGGKHVPKERFAHTEIIGYYINNQGIKLATKNGIIHYSKNGVHIVPSNPRRLK